MAHYTSMIRKSILLTLVVLAVAFAADNYPKLKYELDATWPQLPAGTHLLSAASVAVDGDDNVYVFHRGTNPIQVFDRRGRFVREFGKDLFTNAHGLTIDHEGNLWTVDNRSNFVAKMDTDGRVKMILGTRGSAGESAVLFDKPTDCFIAPNGDIYVSDGYGNSRIAKFDKDGNFLTAWGKKGVNPGEFNIPHSITLDKDGLVYVADRENYRIQIFNSDGRFLKAWTHVGSPWGLFMTDDGLYMSDGYNDRVLKLDLEGKILGSLGGPGSAPGKFRFPHHLALDSNGAIYVAEILNLRAQRFTPIVEP